MNKAVVNPALLIESVLEPDVSGSFADAKCYKKISEVMAKIHNTIPSKHYNTTKIASPIDIREELFDGMNYQRAVMYLMSNGCEWALKEGNGCSVCGHLSRQARLNDKICTEDFIKQFNSVYNTIDFMAYPILNLYNNGSFINDNEIPANAQKAMLTRINENPYIKMVVLESRPEYINEDKIRQVKEWIPDKHVEIACGLEVYDDYCRYLCLNKGFSLNEFERASRIVVGHLNLRTYVMLKPPFLSEKESINQAVEAARFAFSIGANIVSLEACTIQEYTLTDYLHKYSGYRTAWLWSIIEVLKKTAQYGKIIVGMFKFYPSPTKVPSNCPKCNEEVLDRIRWYNRTLDMNCFDGLYCECKVDWESSLDTECNALEDRVLNQLEKVNKFLS